MLSEFKTFLLRGNLVELAVAIVIGVAFGAVVTSLVENMVTPLIAALGGQPDFSALSFTVNDSEFRYGLFLNAVLSFLLIAAVIFFLVIRPVNTLVSRANRQAPDDPTLKQCPHCRLDVPIDATRCSHCTSEVPAGPLG